MKNKKILLIGIFVLFIIAVLLSLGFGAVKLSVSDIWNAMINGPVGTSGMIFWYSRLPRTAACLLAGAALAVSGAVIQSVLHNPLASPGIIGVNTGAGLAVTVCCASGVVSGWAVAGTAFIGAMIAMLLVVFIGQKTGASRTTVILAGVAVNAILNALTEAITSLFPQVAMMNADFRVGGFAAVSHIRIIPAGIIIMIVLAVLMLMGTELDVLSIGDDTAKSLGMSVKKMRIFFLILAAMLAGCAVSFTGLLGFVGLIVPHVFRRMIGNDNFWLLPLCTLGGASFVTLCDTASRVVFAPYELPVGILMSLIGGPVFLLLLFRKKGGRNHA